MSQRLSVALAAAALIGLGGLATPGAVTVAAADGAKSLSIDVSAQRRPGGGGGARPAARPARPAARPARPAARPVRPAARPARPAARPARPAARPAARPVRPAARRVGAGRVRAGALRIGGRRVVVVRGPRRVFWRGRYWPLVPIVALGAFTVGAIAYSAYAYVPVEQPLCSGTTEDGCILRWTNVPAQDDPTVLVPQCVTYCPQ